MKDTPLGIHVLAKPVGPLCNLNCEYCFYLEKQALFKCCERFRMSDDVLSALIANTVESQQSPVVEFVWQGGEPTLLGLEFFERVIELQRPYTKSRMIRNCFQTNGVLLSKDWCRFLKKHEFLVGLSIDGPKEIHDRYRRDTQGNGSFDRVMRGLQLLQQHSVAYNVLVSVARETARRPMEVYRFLRESGVKFIQFSPIVERKALEHEIQHGLRLAGPAPLDRMELTPQVTPWSVLPEDYGDFLITIYEEWIHHDVGKIFVMNFEWALNAWIGNPSPVCVHAAQCGRSLAVEHDGEVYACDHCVYPGVYPEYRLGNVCTDSLVEMAERSRRSGFGTQKETRLPRQCRECKVLAACRGGCPKHRFTATCRDEPGLHYLCAGYKKFFLYIRKYCHAMTQLLANGYPASTVMKAFKGPLVLKTQNREQFVQPFTQGNSL